MKNLRIFGYAVTMAATMLLSTVANAQLYREPGPVKNLPSAVEANFAKKFGDKKPTWHVRYRGDDNTQQRYEGKFMMDNRRTSAVYNNNGLLEAMVFEVEKSEVPKKAMFYMKKNYRDNIITETSMVQENSKDSKTFEVGFFIDKIFKVAVFDSNGDFLRLVNG